VQDFRCLFLSNRAVEALKGKGEGSTSNKGVDRTKPWIAAIVKAGAVFSQKYLINDLVVEFPFLVAKSRLLESDIRNPLPRVKG